MERELLVARAATDLVNKVINEVNYLYVPRYFTMSDNKKVQTNPYADMNDAEQTAALVDALTMLLGQVAASAFALSDKVDQAALYAHFNTKIKKHGDVYHQEFLEMKETHGKNTNKGSEGEHTSNDADVPADGSKNPSNKNG